MNPPKVSHRSASMAVLHQMQAEADQAQRVHQQQQPEQMPSVEVDQQTIARHIAALNDAVFILKSIIDQEGVPLTLAMLQDIIATYQQLGEWPTWDEQTRTLVLPRIQTDQPPIEPSASAPLPCSTNSRPRTQRNIVQVEIQDNRETPTEIIYRKFGPARARVAPVSNKRSNDEPQHQRPPANLRTSSKPETSNPVDMLAIFRQAMRQPK